MPHHVDTEEAKRYDQTPAVWRGIRFGIHARSFIYFDPQVFPVYKRIKGVYLLDEVYVGASHHITSRVISHVNCVLSDNHNNKALADHIRRKARLGHPIVVTRLSEEITDEYDQIQWHLQQRYSLLNSTKPQARAFRPKP